MHTKIAVVIPSYKVRDHVPKVIESLGEQIWKIYVVDDCCPEGSGKYVEKTIDDSRVCVLYHAVNLGVGGAVMTGYRRAISDGATVIVKVDGDGQMDTSLIGNFVEPILDGSADYTKGNRFFDLERVRAMPKIRLWGNALLSLMTKLSSGYWDLFDPTNGFTAIHADVARHLPFEKISRSYFFETDMLFRLNTLRAVVIDVPMDAKYGDEISNLRISKIVGEFLVKHLRNFIKRVFYTYYLRDMSIASLELPLGFLLFFSGCIFGSYHWIDSFQKGITTPTGTVMLAALPILMGTQFILAFLGYDIANIPRRPLHHFYRKSKNGSNILRKSE
jgi:glycosyltransferase involved in cell wall biosynthesis